MSQQFDNADLTSVPAPDEKDIIAFEVKGYTLGWRADGLAIQRASDRGLEVGQILDDITRLGQAEEIREELQEVESEEEIDTEALESLEEVGLQMGEYVRLVARIVFVGAIRIEPAISWEAVLSLVDMHSIGDLPLEEMVSRLVPEIEEEDTVGKDPEAQAQSPR